MTGSYRRSVDGILPTSSPQRQLKRPQTPPRPKTQPERLREALFVPAPQSLPFWKKALRAIGQTLLFMLLLILGLLIQSAAIGQLAIFLYALAAFIFKISSRMTFFLVLGCFMVVLFASARSDITLAATFAMYAFLLLVIGTISLAREVRSEI